MARTSKSEPGTAPTQTPQRAIELIKAQIAKMEALKTLSRKDPEYSKWASTTEAVLLHAFGKPNEIHNDFQVYGSAVMNMPEQYYEAEHQKRLLRKKATLDSAIEQLEILAPPAAQVASGQYVFHAEIERVSGQLFRDGHYASAALQAYIRVIDEVKIRSGLSLDGDNLMNQAFGCAGGRTPVLKFTPLATAADQDEQQGFMYLFKGIVSFRNSKAHSNSLFNDPLRAHDYLALASLLMRVLELASK